MLIVNLGYEQIFGPPSRIRTPKHRGRSSVLFPVKLMEEKKDQHWVAGHGSCSCLCEAGVYPTQCYQYREHYRTPVYYSTEEKIHSVKGHQK